MLVSVFIDMLLIVVLYKQFDLSLATNRYLADTKRYNTLSQKQKSLYGRNIFIASHYCLMQGLIMYSKEDIYNV